MEHKKPEEEEMMKKKVTDTAAEASTNKNENDENTTTVEDDVDYPDLSFDSLEDFVSMDFFSVPSSSSWIFVRAWNIMLASSAWMDFLAATVDSHMRSYLTWETERFDPWLRRHALELGMLFSVLWFLDAFVTASTWRRHRLVQAEEEWLSKSSSSSGGGGLEKFNQRRFKLQAWLGFAQAVILQLVLLPVGFYYVMWGHVTLWDNDEVHPKDMGHHKSGKNGTETFSATTAQAHNVSVLVTVLHFFLAASIRRIQNRVVIQGKKGLFHLIRRILRHPVRAARSGTPRGHVQQIIGQCLKPAQTRPPTSRCPKGDAITKTPLGPNDPGRTTPLRGNTDSKDVSSRSSTQGCASLATVSFRS
eukprot:scaffold10926_cov163-Amphora_coffeaeformis.AAC.5